MSCHQSACCFAQGATDTLKAGTTAGIVIGGACLMTAVCLMGAPRLMDAGVTAAESAGVTSAHSGGGGMSQGGDLGGERTHWFSSTAN